MIEPSDFYFSRALAGQLRLITDADNTLPTETDFHQIPFATTTATAIRERRYGKGRTATPQRNDGNQA